MGTALRFNEESRAAFMAIALQNEGFGVLWKPCSPNVVMTSANKTEVREISNRLKGIISDWISLPEIDCGERKK